MAYSMSAGLNRPATVQAEAERNPVVLQVELEKFSLTPTAATGL